MMTTPRTVRFPESDVFVMDGVPIVGATYCILATGHLHITWHFEIWGTLQPTLAALSIGDGAGVLYDYFESLPTYET